jgi:hypothetical protein
MVMPPATTSPNIPHFVIDATADEEVSVRLRTLERRINENPAEFSSVLTALGDAATKDTIEIDKRNKRQITLKKDPADMLKEYFAQRFDLEMTFDDATEAMLDKDSEYLSLLEDLHHKTSDQMRKGKMGSFIRPNADAPAAREKLRRHRLQFYIGQVVTAQTTNSSNRTSKGKLRSAG